jgi:pimeloyl-ACP methyl ester carboxylesterase
LGVPETNLDVHVHDVVRLIESLPAEQVVLCGHSHAGLVITGAADRVPEHIEALVTQWAAHDPDSPAKR